MTWKGASCPDGPGRCPHLQYADSPRSRSPQRRPGKRVHSLNIGQPDIPSPPELLERLRGFDETNVPYGPSEGLPEFIDAIRDYYVSCDLAVDRSEIFVTTGGSEALLFVLGAVADDGDEVLVFEPFYTNYNGFAGLVGGQDGPGHDAPG